MRSHSRRLGAFAQRTIFIFCLSLYITDLQDCSQISCFVQHYLGRGREPASKCLLAPSSKNAILVPAVLLHAASFYPARYIAPYRITCQTEQNAQVVFFHSPAISSSLSQALHCVKFHTIIIKAPLTCFTGCKGPYVPECTKTGNGAFTISCSAYLIIVFFRVCSAGLSS